MGELDSAERMTVACKTKNGKSSNYIDANQTSQTGRPGQRGAHGAIAWHGSERASARQPSSSCPGGRCPGMAARAISAWPVRISNVHAPPRAGAARGGAQTGGVRERRLPALGQGPCRAVGLVRRTQPDRAGGAGGYAGEWAGEWAVGGNSEELAARLQKNADILVHAFFHARRGAYEGQGGDAAVDFPGDSDRRDAFSAFIPGGEGAFFDAFLDLLAQLAAILDRMRRGLRHREQIDQRIALGRRERTQDRLAECGRMHVQFRARQQHVAQCARAFLAGEYFDFVADEIAAHGGLARALGKQFERLRSENL